MPINPNCSEPAQQVNADSDIVGPGAIAAFLTTAVATVAAIISAYLTGSIDESLTNTLDRKIIERVNRKWRHLNKRHTNLSSVPREKSAPIREAKKRAYAQFLLTLSDQQLVTGLAILIAVLVHPHETTIYEMTVVVGLAWLSSVTHLGSLTMLRERIGAHGVTREARVLGALAVLMILFYSESLLTDSDLTPSHPMTCLTVFGHPGPTDLFAWASAVEVAAYLLFFGTISIAYASRIYELYCTDTQSELPSFLLIVLWRLKRTDTGGLSYRDYYEELASKHRVSQLVYISKGNGYKQRLASLKYQYKSSFLSSIPSLLLGFTYAFGQLVYFTWVQAPDLSPASTKIGFGQLVPLLLLLLPILTAAETYFDYRKESHVEKLLMLPLAPLNARSDELMNAAERFEQNHASIQRYFRREIRLQITGNTAASDIESTRRKADFMIKYNIIACSESSLGVVLPVAMFYLDSVGSIFFSLSFRFNSLGWSFVPGIVIFSAIRFYHLVTWFDDIKSIYSEDKRPPNHT